MFTSAQYGAVGFDPNLTKPFTESDWTKGEDLQWVVGRDLPNGTYYIEMDPGVANRKGSKLAHDVATSDIVILSSVWNDWSEPNDSRKVGSDVPNQVLHRDFVEVGSYGNGLYELWVKRR